jgi:4-hydroxy-tetrahydrodipicolinate reductase
VEFTVAESAPDVLVALARAGIPAVSGTTGWYPRLPEVRAAVEAAGSALVYAPNFSVGVAVFRRWIQEVARDLDGLPDYDVSLHETHHAGKVDHPSGTARLLAETLLAETSLKKEWKAGPPQGAADPETLWVTSARVGHVPGIHELLVDGPDDQIVLRHEARSRRGFARGALMAAEWIRGREGVFTLDDLLDDRLQGRQNG